MGRGQSRGAVGRVGAARPRWPVTLAEARPLGVPRGAAELGLGTLRPLPAVRVTAETGAGTGVALVRLYPSEVTLRCRGPRSKGWFVLGKLL